MSEWIECSLGDLLISANTGLDAIKRAPIVNLDTGIKCLRIQDVSQSKQFEDWGFTDVTENNYSKFKLIKDDIIVARTGATVGVNLIINESLNAVFNNGLIRLRAKKNHSSKYIYYLLRSNKYWDHINSIAFGTTSQPNIQINGLLSYKVLIPHFPTQTAIAEILSSLDDKIELNNKTNKNLEDLAQALFKQWFVDFEFPNEKGKPYKSSGGKMVETELGEVPVGWEVLELSAITEKITDGAHISPATTEIGYPMASVKDMTEWGFSIDTCRKIGESDYLNLIKQGCKPLKGDILIAKDGSFLKHAFVLEKEINLVILSSIAILRPNYRINSHLLNFFLKQPTVRERLDTIVTGAVIQRIVLKDFRKFKIPVMPIEIQEKINPIIESIINKIWKNNQEKESLSTLRDNLLPKLISGELEVNQLKKEMVK